MERKPILLRGARQVGKSSSIRELSKQFEYFVEINFEKFKNPNTLRAIFDKDLSTKRICEELFAVFQIPIIPGKTLLFFDEVQSCLPAISSLRFFYEEMPNLKAIGILRRQ